MSKNKKAENKLMWNLDLDEICSFIFNWSPENKVNGVIDGKINSIIKETYEAGNSTDKLALKEKVVTENKVQNITSEQRMRMELVMWLLDGLNTTYIRTEDNLPDGEIESSTLAEKVIVNTLYRYGFLI